MKKGRSRNKRKKTRSRLLWIAIAVIGMAAITVAVCVAGMFKKEEVWKTPEELLVEYMNHIPAQEYEQMYAMLHIEASGNVSQEDFIKRNSAIYEGIEPPPKSVIECPELQEYIVEFGNRKHDKALVAEIQGNVVGAIWVRIMNDYR